MPPKPMMKPNYPVGARVIHTDSYNDEFKGTVTRAVRVGEQDFFEYDVQAYAVRRKGESEWKPYSIGKYGVSDYSLRPDKE